MVKDNYGPFDMAEAIHPEDLQVGDVIGCLDIEDRWTLVRVRDVEIREDDIKVWIVPVFRGHDVPSRIAITGNEINLWREQA